MRGAGRAWRRAAAALAALCCAAAVGGAAAADPLRPGEGVTLRPAVTELREERFQNLIIRRALEALGYSVAAPTIYDYQTLHLAIGSGQADYATVHWDPLHARFYAQGGGDAAMTRRGVFIDGAVQGYLVDRASFAAGVSNLGDLRDPAVARRFDGDGDGKADLFGCPPGWACHDVIEHHLDAFDLRRTIDHKTGPHSASMDQVMARFDTGAPTLFYSWTPYWVSGALPQGEATAWIETPFAALPDGRADDTVFEGKTLGFPVSRLRIVANRAFAAGEPVAAALFARAAIPIEDVSAQNTKMHEGEDSDAAIDAHVDAWIAANRVRFDAWLAAARAAAPGGAR